MQGAIPQSNCTAAASKICLIQILFRSLHVNAFRHSWEVLLSANSNMLSCATEWRLSWHVMMRWQEISDLDSKRYFSNFNYGGDIRTATLWCAVLDCVSYSSCHGLPCSLCVATCMAGSVQSQFESQFEPAKVLWSFRYAHASSQSLVYGGMLQYVLVFLFERCNKVPLESPTPGHVGIGQYVQRTTIA
jgi:hypothetical protein